MPQVDAVVREFAADNVRLVSINQQETPERIRAVVDRLGLSIAVALDREGLVAERYGAVSIPQTVIIDREGKVARVFASTSARFDEQFRAALKSVVAGTTTGD
jgi:peroxiredoxin